MVVASRGWAVKLLEEVSFSEERVKTGSCELGSDLGEIPRVC